MTGVYNHAWLTPYNMEYITQIEIDRSMNVHDKAYVKGMISETSLLAYQNMMDGKTVISLFFQEDEQTQLLFAGFIERMKVTELGEQREVWMELSGLTQVLDRTKVILDYQDITKTNKGMIEGLMKSYPDIDCDINCPDETIQDFMMQYEESDYEFAGRVLSRVGAPVYTTMQGKNGRICYGLSVRDTEVVLNQAEWEVSYDAGEKYRLETDEYLDLGMEIELDGHKLIVISVHNRYLQGESVNEYMLGTKEACATARWTNHEVTGISMDGVIKDCKRDKVKIELSKTTPCEEDKRKWFAYSSPAASTDGSGWYCMPVIGEEIRLFCPTDDENDAYVISAIRKKQEGQTGSLDQQGKQAGQQPENKVLSNAEGQSVSFLPQGIEMTCADSAATMFLNQDGTIEIVAQKDIRIYADETVMMRAERGMCITSANAMTISNDSGSTLVIDTEITENANRIRNNC